MLANDGYSLSDQGACHTFRRMVVGDEGTVLRDGGHFASADDVFLLDRRLILAD